MYCKHWFLATFCICITVCETRLAQDTNIYYLIINLHCFRWSKSLRVLASSRIIVIIWCNWHVYPSFSPTFFFLSVHVCIICCIRIWIRKRSMFTGCIHRYCEVIEIYTGFTKFNMYYILWNTKRDLVISIPDHIHAMFSLKVLMHLNSSVTIDIKSKQFRYFLSSSNFIYL